MFIGKVDRLIWGGKSCNLNWHHFCSSRFFTQITEVSACFKFLTLCVCVQLHTEVCMYLRKHIQGGQWALPCSM